MDSDDLEDSSTIPEKHSEKILSRKRGGILKNSIFTVLSRSGNHLKGLRFILQNIKVKVPSNDLGDKKPDNTR